MNRRIYHKDEIISLSRPVFIRYNVKKAGIFGSYNASAASPDSDVDFVVEFEDTPSLFILGRLKDDLETALEKECDIITMSSLKKDGSEFAKKIEEGLSVVYGCCEIHFR